MLPGCVAPAGEGALVSPRRWWSAGYVAARSIAAGPSPRTVSAPATGPIAARFVPAGSRTRPVAAGSGTRSVPTGSGTRPGGAGSRPERTGSLVGGAFLAGTRSDRTPETRPLGARTLESRPARARPLGARTLESRPARARLLPARLAASGAFISGLVSALRQFSFQSSSSRHDVARPSIPATPALPVAGVFDQHAASRQGDSQSIRRLPILG
jgi:hypothetical protein